MKIGVIAVFASFLGACGSDDSGETCERPTGSWNIRSTEISGDCDFEPSDEIAVYDGTRASLEATPEGCSGSRSLSADSCELIISLQCDIIDGSGSRIGIVEVTGSLEFVSDDRMEGTVEQTYGASDGSTCTSRQSLVGTPL